MADTIPKLDKTVSLQKTSVNQKSAAVKRVEFSFPDVAGFTEQEVEQPFSLTAEGWRCGLRQTEIEDNKQKVKARPFLAWGVGMLLIVQNAGIWFIVVWALNKGQLQDLQLIFSTLIAGSLTQSYFLMRLITEKVFGDINYHNGDEKG